MKLKSLVIVVVSLVALEGVVRWRDTHRDRSGGSAFVDRTLLEVPQIERAHRIVIREKPQSKTVDKNADGFEVRLIVDKDAPIRETVLERRDAEHWAVTNCFGLEADPTWLGETLRDLTRGRLTRFVTNEPQLMNDLGLNLGAVRLEDEHGGVIRQLDFGRKDGGEAYQFVRIDGRDAFVVKHETELVGDPLTWVAGRVFHFEPTEVREIELPFEDSKEAPLKLSRTARTVPFLVDGKPEPSVAETVGKIVRKILGEPMMVAFDRHSPAIETAQQHVVARLRLTLFDGREYRVDYGVVPPHDPTAARLAPYDEGTIAFGFWSCSDSHDLVVRQAAKAVFGYNRVATTGRLPKNRAALTALASPPVAPLASEGLAHTP
jgi:hypothetical protein